MLCTYTKAQQVVDTKHINVGRKKIETLTRACAKIALLFA